MNKQHLFLNDAPTTQNKVVTLDLQKNAMKDDGQGTINFPNGLTITDGTEQWNGTKYDIATMDVSEFRNKLTVNHDQSVEGIIGLVNGLKKVRNRVIIESITFAIKESSMARFVYNMMVGGYVTDFSIETMGPWPDDDDVYYNSKLVGLSAVAYGNNKSAYINEMNKIAINSVKQSKEDGLDTSLVEKNYICYDETQANANIKEESEMKRKIKNSRGYSIQVKFKNEQGVEETVTIKPGETVEVPADQGDNVQSQVDDSKDPEVEKPAGASAEDVGAAVKNAMAPLLAKVSELEQKVFDNSAQEPEFVVARNSKPSYSDKVGSQMGQMSYQERHAEQINSFLAFKRGSMSAGQKLNTLNEYNLEDLKRAEIVPNSITIADMGNFVISKELITEIQGRRSNYQSLLSKFTFKDTLSIDMGWLQRNGDIDMQPVDFCDDGADGNLKPISEYGATPKSAQLEELAAVTPICNAATRFVAVDILGDVAAGYRNDFDRKKAQLIIALLHKASVEANNTSAYNRTSATTALTSFVDVLGNIQEDVDTGFWIMNKKSALRLVKDAITAGISGPLAELLMTGNMKPLLGEDYIIVPNDLMPTLDTPQTKTYYVNGEAIVVNEGVFFADPSVFTGRTSGGLMYDLSTEASYEDGEKTKSAYQRNEVLLRGSFFRGGAILDPEQVAGMSSAGVS